MYAHPRVMENLSSDINRIPSALAHLEVTVGNVSKFYYRFCWLSVFLLQARQSCRKKGRDYHSKAQTNAVILRFERKIML